MNVCCLLKPSPAGLDCLLCSDRQGLLWICDNGVSRGHTCPTCASLMAASPTDRYNHLLRIICSTAMSLSLILSASDLKLDALPPPIIRRCITVADDIHLIPSSSADTSAHSRMDVRGSDLPVRDAVCRSSCVQVLLLISCCPLNADASFSQSSLSFYPSSSHHLSVWMNCNSHEQMTEYWHEHVPRQVIRFDECISRTEALCHCRTPNVSAGFGTKTSSFPPFCRSCWCDVNSILSRYQSPIYQKQHHHLFVLHLFDYTQK